MFKEHPLSWSVLKPYSILQPDGLKCSLRQGNRSVSTTKTNWNLTNTYFIDPDYLLLNEHLSSCYLWLSSLLFSLRSALKWPPFYKSSSMETAFYITLKRSVSFSHRISFQLEPRLIFIALFFFILRIHVGHFSGFAPPHVREIIFIS